MLDISLVTRCMNRASFLRQTLPTWLKLPFKEIIIVDWSSTDDIQSVIDENQDERITRIYVPNREFFSRSKSVNVGVRYVSTRYVNHVDSDVKLFDGWLDVIRDNDENFYIRHRGDYWGCPNIQDFLPIESIIILPQNVNEASDVIKESIANDEYSKRYDAILHARDLLLTKYDLISTLKGIYATIS